MAKFGIYEISSADCRKVYMGKPEKNVEIHLREYLKYAELAEIRMS